MADGLAAKALSALRIFVTTTLALTLEVLADPRL